MLSDFRGMYMWNSKKTIKIIFFLLLATLLLLFWLCLPNPLFRTTYSTTVYDHNGALLGARVSKNGEWQFPPTKELSEKYVTCLITYEDRYFYRHLGVNPVSL
ncbi:MAG: penicillin-binding protein 1C, partial [Bacteroidetes bacterium]|nr:penicillin-binding protein 1C [Bacteroidota bacterium]